MNTIIYARVSSKDQETEGYSIPAQLKALREYASKNNLLVLKEFTDVETAKKAGRTEFNKMLTFIAENKNIKHILVEKTDRLLRNIADYAILDRLIEHSDAVIHLVKENVILSRDSRSNEKFVFGIRALMAKNYVDNLSEEVRKGMNEKAAQGVYPSWAPYGYVNGKSEGRKTILVDPETAPYVKQMFELYATGSYSLLTLRKKMLEDGMIYRNGKNFYKSKIETILKNEFYTGVFFWKGKKYSHASHEPLVSKELFAAVQAKLTNPFKSKSRKGLFPYTNLITCKSCGCKLTAEIKKEKYIYYRCTGYKGNCKQAYIRQEAIETHFEGILASIHIPESFQALVLQGIKESLKEKIEYHNHLVTKLEQQIKVLQNRIDQTYCDKLDGKISEEFWLIKTKQWMAEKELLSLKLFSAQKADTLYLENANLILELAKRAHELFKVQNADQKRKLVELLLSNCSYNGENIDLELKPVFSMIIKSSESGNWCAR